MRQALLPAPAGLTAAAAAGGGLYLALLPLACRILWVMHTLLLLLCQLVRLLKSAVLRHSLPSGYAPQHQQLLLMLPLVFHCAQAHRLLQQQQQQ
jgi:hypothetical protein